MTKKIGDVITFISNSPETKGMTITHRIVSIIKNEDGTYSYQTKGDYNPIEDTGWVNFNSIIGKVALKIPGLGRLQAMVASSTGLLLIILCIALFILLKSLIRKLREQTSAIDVNSPLGKILHKQLYLPYTKRKVIGPVMPIPDALTNDSLPNLAKENGVIEEPHNVSELVINPALASEIIEETSNNDLPEIKKENIEDPKEVSQVEKIIRLEEDTDDFEIDLPDLK